MQIYQRVLCSNVRSASAVQLIFCIDCCILTFGALLGSPRQCAGGKLFLWELHRETKRKAFVPSHSELSSPCVLLSRPSSGVSSSFTSPSCCCCKKVTPASAFLHFEHPKSCKMTAEHCMTWKNHFYMNIRKKWATRSSCLDGIVSRLTLWSHWCIKAGIPYKRALKEKQRGIFERGTLYQWIAPVVETEPCAWNCKGSAFGKLLQSMRHTLILFSVKRCFPRSAASVWGLFWFPLIQNLISSLSF